MLERVRKLMCFRPGLTDFKLSGDRAWQTEMTACRFDGAHKEPADLFGKLRLAVELSLILAVFSHCWECRTISSEVGKPSAMRFGKLRICTPTPYSLAG